jgi:hypothetical protein
MRLRNFTYSKYGRDSFSLVWVLSKFLDADLPVNYNLPLPPRLLYCCGRWPPATRAKPTKPRLPHMRNYSDATLTHPTPSTSYIGPWSHAHLSKLMERTSSSLEPACPQPLNLKILPRLCRRRTTICVGPVSCSLDIHRSPFPRFMSKARMDAKEAKE